MPVPSTNWTSITINSTPWNQDLTSANGYLMDDSVIKMEDSVGTMDDAKSNSIVENSTVWNNP